ncbi:hypothetical protein M406DRAFT_71472 [Cryphonectria parasitica EP155]|uniref:Uncharacterized protein n=1 Tax=Cryphonectria parasitica (strain ATCC 38755 / EP155) TaxID=660469 RepID=A0A9P5CRP4_CRYP1|nr:uncharacterized protein M406DRAFT_71472 [Cryphonectria parasitica EP155]KAF3768468.1 hypothetical protein M406DRAFT_71472 [Cryphonectria parasitica EP155]
MKTALYAGFAKKERCEEVHQRILACRDEVFKKIYTDALSDSSRDEKFIEGLSSLVLSMLSRQCIQHLIHCLYSFSAHTESIGSHEDGTQPGDPAPSQHPEAQEDGANFAGGAVSDCLFSTALTWTEAGETEAVDIPVPEVLTSKERTEAAIAQLRHHYCLIDLTGSSDFGRHFIINPEYSAYLSKEAREASTYWRETALAVLCRAFPRWPHISARASHCKILLPILCHILFYLPRNLNHKLRSHLTEVCISASYFGSLTWKSVMLRYAAHLNPGDPSRTMKIRLRTRMLNKLSLKEDISTDNASLRHSNQHLNAVFGEEIIFEMQGLLEQRVPIKTLEDYFKSFVPLEHSEQEEQILLQGQEILARATRFEGLFDQANTRYIQIMSTYSRNIIPQRFVASYIEILCE